MSLDAWRQRLRGELRDVLDEELEMERDDDQLAGVAVPDTPAIQVDMDRRTYFKELFRLQGELVKLQDWVVTQKLKVVVLFEGRDAAGKGGAIKRISQRMNPRVCRVAALPAPNERERTQWYFQRYVTHLRFQMRIHDPLKQWKLSPMDLESRRRWDLYTKAKEVMLERTHISEARWWVVEADDKKRARLNCIHHMLSQIPYGEVAHPEVRLPARQREPDFTRGPVPEELFVPTVY